LSETFGALPSSRTLMQRQVLLTVFSLALSQTLHAVAPLIADAPDQVIAQNTSTGVLTFVVGDTETTFSALTVAASSDNTLLVPANPANLALGGTVAQRSITVTPATGLTGTARITLTVTDGEGLTASSDFLVTVTPPNTPPAVSGLPAYQLDSPGQTPALVTFTVTDAESTSVGVTATSSNHSLIPNENLALAGSGTSRTLQVTPFAGKRGAAVIRLRVTNASGASAQQEFIFSVFDAAAANNSFRRPSGLYVLDSGAGTQIGGVSMRDANVRNLPFLDGYVLRTEWSTFEPTPGVFNFTIIDNIFTKLPAHQKLSFIINTGSLPAWLNSLPGITTYSAGNPAVTRPYPWDAVAQERYRLMLVALGNHVIDGAPFRSHPRLAAINAGIPGLFGGIREPNEIRIRDMAGYSRASMQSALLSYLGHITDNFPDVPAQLGFWTYTGYQMLGSWARPFRASHMDNNLNGTPADAMDYAFNSFQCRYHEIYQADVDFAGYTAEFQRWHDFLAALPAPPALTLTDSLGGTA
jgi:hypothetical protein